MTSRSSWELAAAIVLPLVSLTIYLVWIWPRPRGTSFAAESGPYVVCLLTGVPFAWRVAARAGRVWLVALYVVVGFVALWLYASMTLCGVRNVCL